MQSNSQGLIHWSQRKPSYYLLAYWFPIQTDVLAHMPSLLSSVVCLGDFTYYRASISQYKVFGWKNVGLRPGAQHATQKPHHATCQHFTVLHCLYLCRICPSMTTSSLCCFNPGHLPLSDCCNPSHFPPSVIFPIRQLHSRPLSLVILLWFRPSSPIRPLRFWPSSPVRLLQVWWSYSIRWLWFWPSFPIGLLLFWPSSPLDLNRWKMMSAINALNSEQQLNTD